MLERYTALTGRPALPPPWSFGLWLSTSFTTSYDEETVTSFIQGMADRDLPLHVFHFDCFWMKEFQWVDFEWDRRVFPDPEAMLQRLKERGLRICVWINPYIAQKSAMFDEGMAERLPASSARTATSGSGTAGRPAWAWSTSPTPTPAAGTRDKLRALVDMGVDCFKTDFGERIPTDVVYHDGSDPVKMHNYYTYLYNKTVFDVLEEKLGKGKATVFARSATAGGQQFPVHWGGDSTATFESMAESLRGGLSLSLCGFGFWSHDISGFEQTAPPEVYKRWCAFGLLSSHSRLHGSQSYRVPWLFDDESVDVLRHFTKLKCRLMPYLFDAARQAHEHGMPMMRPDDAGVPRRSRLRHAGSPVHAGRIAAGGAGLLRRRHGGLLPAGRALDQLPDRRRDRGRRAGAASSTTIMSLPLHGAPQLRHRRRRRGARGPTTTTRADFTLRVYQMADGGTATAVIPAADGSAVVTFSVRAQRRDARGRMAGFAGTLADSADRHRLRRIGYGRHSRERR